MEAAKSVVSKITSRNGHHQTDVDEVVLPAVTSEVVKPQRHEETTEAIDREVHQHHYHTTVQPITHTEVTNEKHTHNLRPQVEREYKRSDESETQSRVSAELARFKDTTKTLETKHTASVGSQIVGEHVHHHVHETVQPIIYKETVEPEVVHTTVPIHEIHYEAAQHHNISVLPMKTLHEVNTVGDVLTGKYVHSHTQYEGPPKPYDSKLQKSLEKVLPGQDVNYKSNITTPSGANGNKTSEETYSNTSGKVIGGPVIHQDYHTKPTLKEKLDPRIDADRDGKAGIFD